MRARWWPFGATLGAAFIGLAAWLAVYTIFPAGHRSGPACAIYGSHVHLPGDRILWVG